MLRFLCALILVFTGCSGAGDIAVPIAADEALPMAAPAAVRLDSAYLNNAARQIEAQRGHKLHSMLVVREGQLAFEQYYNGYARDNPHDLRSATKSITSLLTGIAIERGLLAGVDAPLMDYLAHAYPNVEGKDGILLRHLLTMSSGLDCDDGDRSTRGQEDRMYKSRDWVGYFLSLSTPYAPGDTTRYCTGGVVALGEVIAQGSGEDVAAFADQALFGPLGIQNLRWARFDDERKVDTGGHLLLTPQAMAKVGMVVLQQGAWKGRQLVPAAWIEHSTQPHTVIHGSPYGYLWWIDTARFGDKAIRIIWAQGNGGQKIYVVPEYDLVAVFTAGYYNSEKSQITTQLFINAVLPSIVELQPYLPRRP